MKTIHKVMMAGAVGVSLVGAWVSASAMSSKQVADMLHTAATQGWPDSGFKIRNLQHQSGWFSSSGELELAYIDKCAQLSQGDTTWVQVKYNMSHMLLPSSLMRFDWTLQPTGEAKASFEKIFQGTVALTGSGHMRLGQAFDSNLNLPALSMTSDGTHFEMSPIKGFVSFSGDGLTMDMANDKTNFRGRGQALEIQQTKFSVDLDNRKTGTGVSSLSLGKISASELTLEGLKVTSKAQLFEGRYSMNLSYNLDKAAYQQHQLSELAINYAFNGLHGESVSKLIGLSGASCGFQNMTGDEAQQMRTALKTLLLQGMSTGFTTLSAKLEKGKVEAKLMLDLAKTDQVRVELGQHLKLQGSLQIDGPVLTADQQQTMIDAGFVKANAKGLLASVNYANNQLMLNDKAFNSPMVTMMMSELESKLNDWLDNQRHARLDASIGDLLPAISEADMPSAEAPANNTDH